MLAELLTPKLHSNLREKKKTSQASSWRLERQITWGFNAAAHAHECIDSKQIKKTHTYTEAYNLQSYLHTLMPAHVHAHTPLEAGHLITSSLLSPKRSLYPSSSSCNLYLTGLGREKQTFLLCQHSKDFIKSTFCLVVNLLNNKKFQVI